MKRGGQRTRGAGKAAEMQRKGSGNSLEIQRNRGKIMLDDAGCARIS